MSLTGNPPQFQPSDAVSDIFRAFCMWMVTNQYQTQQDIATNTANNASSVTMNGAKFDTMISSLSDIDTQTTGSKTDLDTAVGLLTQMLAVQSPINPQPTVFGTAEVTVSGDTTLWTPATGKKIQLMGYDIQITGNNAISLGGVLKGVIKESTFIIGGLSAYFPAVALTSVPMVGTGWRPLSRGYIGSAINSPLKLNLSTALGSGASCRVNWIGTEV